MCVGFCVHFWPLLLSPNVRKCNSAVAKPCSLVLHTKVITCVRRTYIAMWWPLPTSLFPFDTRKCRAPNFVCRENEENRVHQKDLETKVEAGTQRRKGRETALVMNCVEIRFFFFSSLIFSLTTMVSTAFFLSRCWGKNTPGSVLFPIPHRATNVLPSNVQIKCQRILYLYQVSPLTYLLYSRPSF